MNQKTMVSETGGNFSRTARMSLAALTISAGLLLAACGGGGGGSSAPAPTPPAPPPAPTPPNLTLASTAPDNGATDMETSNVAMQMNFKNNGGQMDSVTGTFRASCGGADIASTTITTIDTANSTARFAVTITGTMPNSTVCQVFTTDVKGSGPGGSSSPVSAQLTFTTKAAPKLVYTDLILSYSGHTAGWPQKTMPDGSQVVTSNKTKYAGFLNCWPATRVNPDGTIPHTCQASFGEDRYYDIYLDPATMELKNSAVTPTGVTYVLLTEGHLRVPADKPTWRTSAQKENGDYVYIHKLSPHVIRSFSVAGVESVIYTGDAAKFESYALVMAYSNR